MHMLIYTITLVLFGLIGVYFETVLHLTTPTIYFVLGCIGQLVAIVLAAKVYDRC